MLKKIFLWIKNNLFTIFVIYYILSLFFIPFYIFKYGIPYNLSNFVCHINDTFDYSSPSSQHLSHWPSNDTSKYSTPDYTKLNYHIQWHNYRSSNPLYYDISLNTFNHLNYLLKDSDFQHLTWTRICSIHPTSPMTKFEFKIIPFNDFVNKCNNDLDYKHKLIDFSMESWHNIRAWSNYRGLDINTLEVYNRNVSLFLNDF